MKQVIKQRTESTMTTSDIKEMDMTDILGHDQKNSQKKRTRLILFILGLLAILLIVIFLFSGNSDSIKYSYQKKKIERGNLTNTVSATGNLEPTNQVDVGSELSGIIDTVNVDFNDTVSVGQILAVLDTTKLEAKVTQSQAALESVKAKVLQSKATVRETKAKLDRMKQARELSGGKVPSLYDIEAAEAAYERATADLVSAQAAIAEAQATLDSNREDLSKAKILSPINGVVLDRSVERGQTVAASLQAPVLFTLAEDLTQMELHVDVDEADVGLVHEGQKASFTVDAYPERTFSAEITQVRFGAQTSEGVVTYETVLKVDNTDLLLRPGMTATADIVVQQVNDKILVPNAALRFKPPDNVSAGLGEGQGNKNNSSVIFKILHRGPRRPNRSSEQEKSSTEILSGSHQSIYIERNGQLHKIPIIAGVTNGIMTEIIEGDINQGDDVVVNLVRNGS